MKWWCSLSRAAFTLRAVSTFFGLVLVHGCTPSLLTRTALESDLPALRAEIKRAQAAGRLDVPAVRELAGAVARRELLSSQGDEAVARIRELGPCLAQLRDDVEERAQADQGAAAATATLALLEAGLLPDVEELTRRYAKSVDPMWRAVAARALRSGDELPHRSAWFLDGDLRVRRAALHAALEAPLVSELGAVLEVARLDPDPLARSLAIRLIGRFDDVRATRGLFDLWGRAEPAARQAIVEAWAATPQADGMKQVLWVIETQSGLPQVVAAARAQRAGYAQAQSVAALNRLILSSPSDEQRLALRLAPALPELAVAVEKAAANTDLQVQVAALRAELSYGGKKAAALKALRLHSKKSPPLVAREAREALVAVRDADVVADLLPDLDAAEPEQRAAAGLQLVALERYTEVALRLADDAASVRTRVACSILAR